jgi:hypothetical protein
MLLLEKTVSGVLDATLENTVSGILDTVPENTVSGILDTVPENTVSATATATANSGNTNDIFDRTTPHSPATATILPNRFVRSLHSRHSSLARCFWPDKPASARAGFRVRFGRRHAADPPDETRLEAT